MMRVCQISVAQARSSQEVFSARGYDETDDQHTSKQSYCAKRVVRSIRDGQNLIYRNNRVFEFEISHSETQRDVGRERKRDGKREQRGLPDPPFCCFLLR